MSVTEVTAVVFARSARFLHRESPRNQKVTRCRNQVHKTSLCAQLRALVAAVCGVRNTSKPVKLIEF
jgi:hypothetical protein